MLELFEDDVPKELCYRLILKYMDYFLRLLCQTTYYCNDNNGQKQVYSTSKFALRRDITYTLCFEQ